MNLQNTFFGITFQAILGSLIVSPESFVTIFKFYTCCLDYLISVGYYFIVILYFLFGVDLGKHSLSYSLGHLGAVRIIIVRSIFFSICQVGNNLFIALLGWFTRRIVSRVYLIDVIRGDRLCNGCNNREWAPKACHSEHHQCTENFSLSLIGMIFCIWDLATFLQLFYAIDEHIGLSDIL